MIYQSRTVITTKSGIELGTHGTSLFPVGAYDNDFTDREAIWHWHRELELIHMVKGSLLVSLPNEQIILNSGEVLFINSGVMHAASNARREESGLCTSSDAGDGGCFADGLTDGENRTCILHSAVFLPEFICNGTEGVFWQKYLCPLIENSRLHSMKFSNDLKNTSAAREYMNKFWAACEKEPFGYEFTVREQLSGILRYILSECEKENSVRPISFSHQRAAERVKRMLEYIHENYMSEITARQLAAQASISESECLRCFRSVLGTTPIQYVKKYRLQLAADMLMTTEYSITEIAGKCGFGHMSYFARGFSELFGVTPREYRSRERQQGGDVS